MVNKIVFKEKFCESCPEFFFRIAFLCTEVDAEDRPPFEMLERWLANIALYLPTLHTILKELMNEIVSFPDYQSALRASRRRRPHRTRRAGRCTRAYSCGPLLRTHFSSLSRRSEEPEFNVTYVNFKKEIPIYKGAGGVDANEGTEGGGGAAVVSTVVGGTIFSLSIHSPKVVMVIGGIIGGTLAVVVVVGVVGLVAWLI
ncbi:unnamed protein product, partial [Oppiella nova]